MTKEFWDERYKQEAYAYGVLPNEFLKAQLDALTPGTILFPAEGEGRNAVYAATRGWTVSAFDQSAEGQKKAYALAEKNKVSIEYHVVPVDDLPFQKNQFDAVALIYAHFAADVKSQYNRKMTTFLKPGGILIFEAYSKRHMANILADPRVGGPKDIDMLFSLEEIQADFADFETLLLTEETMEQREGLYHQGLGTVVRFVGRKK
jgi:2-polyprenyl-3-methyl-5-hydroxy-6-metoxy-1,4-benzoquinol methylase